MTKQEFTNLLWDAINVCVDGAITDANRDYPMYGKRLATRRLREDEVVNKVIEAWEQRRPEENQP